MSSLPREAFAGEQSGSQRKAVESPSLVNMICNMLNFLDASPMTLFEGPPSETANLDRFYEENFSSIVSCVVAANESIRRLAAGVAKRLFHEGVILTTLRESQGLDSSYFKFKFWRLRYVLVNTLE